MNKTFGGSFKHANLPDGSVARDTFYSRKLQIWEISIRNGMDGS